VGLRFDGEESLRVVIDAVRAQTGLPLIVDRRAENAVFDAGVLFDFELTYPVAVHDCLNLISDEAGGECTWLIRHDAVLVTTKERARARPVVVLHDVRTMIMARTDFSGPRIDRLRLLDELEDDDGGGPFGGVGESVQRMEEDDVATLVQENVAVGRWDEDGVSIEPHNGFLIVVHEPAVQRSVKRFLDTLR